MDHAQGNSKGALEAYEKALRKNPEHSEALIARAGLRVDQGRLEEALRDIAEVRRLTPSDPRGPYLAGQIASRQGDNQAAKSAMADVTGILDPVPLDFLRYKPQLMVLGGLAHFALGQNEKARPYLESVVRQQPTSPVAKLLGQIYQNAGNHDLAIETLEGYLKAHPRDTQAIVVLATSNLGRGRAPRAIQLLQDAVKIEDTPHLRTMLGMSLVGGGRRAEALPEFENSFRRDPSQVSAGAALVSLYLGRNNTAKAIEVAESLIKRMPKDAQFQSMLGSARAQAGDKAKARAAFEQATRLDPSFTPAQIELARLEVQANQLDAAAKRLSDVLAKDAKHIEALIEMSAIMDRQGQRTRSHPVAGEGGRLQCRQRTAAGPDPGGSPPAGGLDRRGHAGRRPAQRQGTRGHPGAAGQCQRQARRRRQRRGAVLSDPGQPHGGNGRDAADPHRHPAAGGQGCEGRRLHAGQGVAGPARIHARQGPAGRSQPPARRLRRRGPAGGSDPVAQPEQRPGATH